MVALIPIGVAYAVLFVLALICGNRADCAERKRPAGK